MISVPDPELLEIAIVQASVPALAWMPRMTMGIVEIAVEAVIILIRFSVGPLSF